MDGHCCAYAPSANYSTKDQNENVLYMDLGENYSQDDSEVYISSRLFRNVSYTFIASN